MRAGVPTWLTLGAVFVAGVQCGQAGQAARPPLRVELQDCLRPEAAVRYVEPPGTADDMPQILRSFGSPRREA